MRLAWRAYAMTMAKNCRASRLRRLAASSLHSSLAQGALQLHTLSSPVVPSGEQLP